MLIKLFSLVSTFHWPPLRASTAWSVLALMSTAVAADPAGDLVVHATGFKSTEGHAVAKLFVAGDNVRRKGRLEVAALIHDGAAQVRFPALAPGEYAVVVFHDANDNGTIDHSLLGFPIEALGFSNGFTLSVFSGLPTFEKLRFSHGEREQTLNIHVE